MTDTELELRTVMEKQAHTIDKCRHGHLWTEKNTRWYPNKKGGKKYRACRRCEADRYVEKYHRDPEHRLRVLKTGKAWRAKRKMNTELDTLSAMKAAAVAFMDRPEYPLTEAEKALIEAAVGWTYGKIKESQKVNIPKLKRMFP